MDSRKRICKIFSSSFSSKGFNVEGMAEKIDRVLMECMKFGIRLVINNKKQIKIKK